jgi:UDP-3-O-[3-hydroxymyristoyl] glucosamine N-acyltransferase
VDIGSYVCIDKGTMSDTVIGRGSKIDNLCQISHNVVLGENCIILSQSAIAGGTKIGDSTWVAPHACIKDTITIGKNVVVGMGSVVTKSIDDGWTVYGVPAKLIKRNV